MNKTNVDITSGFLSGEGVQNSQQMLSGLKNVFANEAARAAMDPETVVYQVQRHGCIPDGTAGGLFFGTSNVMPGQVAGEYFMTRGHFHQKREAGEYYWGIQGKGALILMDEQGKCRMEIVESGTLHYIPGHTAHRLANTGDQILRVGACWPADAGHDYAAIAQTGFSARLMDVNGVPTLISFCEKETL